MRTGIEAKAAATGPLQDRISAGSENRGKALDDFRRWGYLQANLDPLGQYLQPVAMPELSATGPIADRARQFYCGAVGVEFMHIPEAAKREWITERFERDPSAPDRKRILDLLIRADIFEQVIQSRYAGTKRFSLEGVTALIPFLDAVLDCAADAGMQQAVLAMSHRGRLNVMRNVIGASPAAIFSRFEDIDPRSVLGGGDVKYHMGATGRWNGANGRSAELHLVSNPSHLEAVDAVAMGRARAKQEQPNSNDS